jgi:hypothetical protein
MLEYGSPNFVIIIYFLLITHRHKIAFLLPASTASVATFTLSCSGDFVKIRYQQAKRLGTIRVVKGK